MAVATPSPNTLKKYGLSEAEWRVLCDRQGGVCAVCKQAPKPKGDKPGRLCIDHFHAEKWKKKPPEERKTWVRGLLCFRCNTSFVGRGVTIERSQNVVIYLQEFERYRANLSPPQT